MKHLTILPAGYGHWKVTFDLRGKSITKVTTNSQAIDRWSERHQISSRTRSNSLTEKQAYRILTGLSK